VPFFGGDGWDSGNTLALPADVVKDCYFANHYSADDPRQHVQEFVKKYQAEYGKTPDAMAILGYDAGRVMADAIQRAGRVDPKAIRDALTTTSQFPGASGNITIDSERNALKPLVIVAVENGKTVTVDTIEP
jgi:branched-chain amino acid transport system substrate-binding protein